MAADGTDAGSWVGRDVSHYRVIDRLGAGGMGEVYRAEDLRLGRFVALKRLKPEFTTDDSARRRFELEARAVARLSHPHITTVFDFDAAAGFLTLELVEGFSLEEALAGGALEPVEAVRIAAALARALDHAHGRNVIHRDLKPSNVLLDHVGAVKLTDFGLARIRDDAGRTSTGAVLGTAAYMSPEQIRGRGVDRRSDLFSLGVVLYRALTGRLPWNGEGLAVLYSILHDTPRPLVEFLPEAPPALLSVVERLLTRDPEVRTASAGEAARDLEALGPLLPGAGAGATQPASGVSNLTTRPAGAGAGPASASDLDVSLSRRPHVPLIGRDAELRQLLDALELVRFGGGRTVLIEGEAGVGKSRLVDELRGAAESLGVLALSGRCAYQEGRHFGPFVEALEELSRRRESEFAGTPTGEPAPGLRETLDLLVHPAGVLAAEPRSREQVWVLVDTLLRTLSRETPLLLTLEDLHWADEGTVSLLHHLTRNLGRSRLLVIGLLRPEELHREGGAESPMVDLLRVLAPVESVQRLTLGRLGEEATRALVAAVLPGMPLAEELTPTVHRRSQGNPLFTLEILRYLQSAASASVLPRGLAETMALPSTISDVLLRRLSRLSTEERDLLELAAVEGDTFDLETLVSGSGEPRMTLLRRLRVLGQKHQLVEPDEAGYRFSHQLVREVLLREMPADLRREYHAIVADLHLERFGDRRDVAGRAGYHLYEAGRHAEAVSHLVSAAEDARRLFLYDRALRLFDQALDAGDRAAPGDAAADAARRARLQRRRCDLLLLLGRPDEAGRAADEAMAAAAGSGDPLDRAAGEERLGEVALARGEHAAAARHLEAAQSHYAAAGERSETTRCRQRLGTLASRRGEYERARTHFAVAEAGWVEIGDETARAGVRLELGEVAALTGDAAGAEALFRAAIDVYRAAGDRSGLARGLLLSANLHFQSGDTSQSLERYREAIAISNELGDIQSGARCMANLGNVFLVRGDPVQARTSYRAARARFEEIGDQRGAASALVAEGNVEYALGRFADAAALYARAVPARTAMGDRWGVANVLDNMSVAEYHLGRWAEALPHSRSALAIREQLGDRPGCAESSLNLANLLAVLGDRERAEEGYERAAQLAEAVANRRKLASVHLARAAVALWFDERERALALVDRALALGLEEPALDIGARLCAGLAGRLPPGRTAVEELHDLAGRAALTGSTATHLLVETALAAALVRAGDREAASRLLVSMAERLEACPIPLLQLEILRLGRELGEPGVEPREAALLARLDSGLPEGWEITPRYRLRTFPVP